MPRALEFNDALRDRGAQRQGQLNVVIEGKRKEGRTTHVTCWMEGRHQMWRHIDCAWERRGAKQVCGFLIVESPEQAAAFASETALDDAISKSLPHRSAAEVVEITRCFLVLPPGKRSVITPASRGNALSA